MDSQDNNEIKIKVGIHYLKDLSIENANAPGIFTIDSSSAPRIDVNYDISVSRLGAQEDSTSSFEVMLSVTVHSKITEKASEKEHNLFVCEVKYAGIFSIGGNDEMSEKRVLFIYAPNMLFPFLRRIIATSTGDCGFPPLMLDPIDFATQFKKQNKQK